MDINSSHQQEFIFRELPQKSQSKMDASKIRKPKGQTSKKTDGFVPGEIPEAPNIASFVDSDSRSIAASSLSSFSSVFNSVSSTNQQFSNFSKATAKRVTVTSAPVPRPAQVLNSVSRTQLFGHNATATVSESPRHPPANVVPQDHMPFGSCSSSRGGYSGMDTRQSETERAAEEREKRKRLAESSQCENEQVLQRHYAQQKRNATVEWAQWQAASTASVVAQDEKRAQEKRNYEECRKQEIQAMFDRQGAVDRERGHGNRDAVRNCSERAVDEESKNGDHRERQPQRRKQGLFHRLLGPSNSERPLGYVPVEAANPNSVAGVTARALNPETLFFVSGDLIDLSCFDQSKELSVTAMDSYLNILEVKNETSMRSQKLQVWSRNSIFNTTKSSVFADGTLREIGIADAQVSDEFLNAVSNADESLAGVLRIKQDYVGYVINKTTKKVYVKDCRKPASERSFSKILAAVENRLQQPDWELEFRDKPILPYSKSCDAAVHALYALETVIQNSERLPGVSTLHDYRQKLKWSIISESDSCLKAIEETKSNLKKKIKECHKNFLATVAATRSLPEMLEALQSFEVEESKLKCQKCKTTKNFKPLSLPESEDTKAFQYLKGHVMNHLKSSSHMKNIGVSVEVSENHPESAYRGAKTFEQLKNLYTWLERKDEETLVCTACDDKTAGKFKYPDEQSSAFASKFSVLKSRVRSHSQLESHKSKEASLTSEKNLTIGKILGLNSYICVKNGLGLSEYERHVNNDYAKTMAVGELNHSRGFVTEMRKHFAEVLRSKFKAQSFRILDSTGTVPKTSIAADKFTEFGKSYHIIAAVSHVGAQNHSFVLDVVESSGNTGDHMAADIYQALKEYFPEEIMKDVIVAGCMDGDYHNKKVPEKLMDLMGISEENRQAYSYQWDNAHVLELACKDARQQKDKMSSIGEKWIRETLTTISTISNDYRMGNPLKELKELAQELQLEGETGAEVQGVKRFQTYSTTRFSSHLSNFINAMEINYPLVHKHLSESDPINFAAISSPEFVTRMTGLNDLYKLVGEASKKLQVVHKMPWHSGTALQDLREKLQKVVNACSAETFRPANEVLPSFSNCCSEVLAYQSFKGQELNMVPNKRLRSAENTGRDVATIVSKEAHYVGEHAKALMESLDTRMFSKPGKARKTVAELYGADTLSLIQECFSFEKIRNGDATQPLKMLHELYTSSGLLKSSAPFEELENQHRQLCNEVRTMYPATVDVKTETDFYFGKLDGPASQYPLLMETLSISANRNCVETVVETMTSQLGSILEGRTNLTTRNLRDEIIVRHNGPPAGPKAEKLVEAALDLKFDSKPWKFVRTSGDKNTLKSYTNSSKVLDRLQIGSEKIVF